MTTENEVTDLQLAIKLQHYENMNFIAFNRLSADRIEQVKVKISAEQIEQVSK